MITDLAKNIRYVSKLYAGSVHDFKLFKEEFSHLDWDIYPQIYKIWVDLGFLGIDKIIVKQSVFIPHKKQKKQPLTEEQKAENRQYSRTRIKVENALSLQKRYAILKHDNRTKHHQSINDIVLICAALANYKNQFKH